MKVVVEIAVFDKSFGFSATFDHLVIYLAAVLVGVDLMIVPEGVGWIVALFENLAALGTLVAAALLLLLLLGLFTLQLFLVLLRIMMLMVMTVLMTH